MRLYSSIDTNCYILDTVFSNFVDQTGGAVSIKLTTITFETQSSSYFLCTATSYDTYFRDRISGGAIAVYVKSSKFTQNCFEQNKCDGLGTAVYAASDAGNNNYSLNTFFRNKNGDGQLTSDGNNEISLIDNNFTYATLLTNAGTAIQSPSTDKIKYNNFAHLKSQGYLFWASKTAVVSECNFIDYVTAARHHVFAIFQTLTLRNCMMFGLPQDLVNDTNKLFLINVWSDEVKLQTDTVIDSGIVVTSDRSAYPVGGRHMCYMHTLHKCTKTIRGIVLGFAFLSEFKNDC